MKKLSKIMSVALALLLLLGAIPLPVQAAPAITPVAEFQGIGDELKATVTFNYSTMQIEAVLGDPYNVHDYFSGEYFGVSVYDANRRLVINASQIGVAGAAGFVNSLNGVDFGIGYVIQIRHQEASTRLVLNGGFNPDEQTTVSEYYQVTDSGLDMIDVSTLGPEIVVSPRTVYAGDSFDPLASVYAYDIIDGDISDSVRNTYNGVDSNTPGIYRVDYTVADSNGVAVFATSTVTVIPQPTLEIAGGSVYVGDTMQLETDYTPAGAILTYRTLNPGIATVSESGVITGINDGEADIEVQLTTADGVKTIIQTATVMVKELPVVHAGDNMEFYVGEYRYAGTIYVPSDASLVYRSANPEIATVDANGRVTGVGAGVTQITATVTTVDGLKTDSSSFAVAVLALPEVTISDQTIYFDETIPLQYQAVPDTATATFSSNNEAVLTIDANGNMTPHALGVASVQVQLVTIDGEKTASAKATVRVLPLPTVQVSDYTLYNGERVQVLPQYTPGDAIITYTIGDSTIATIDGTGNLTAQKNGTTTLAVTATTADGRKSSTQTVQVTVFAQPQISVSGISLYTGDSEQVIPEYSPADAVLSFSSADTSVAAVAADGTVTGKRPGTTTITVRATTSDGKYFAEATATVTVSALPVIDAENLNLYSGDTAAVKVTVAPDDASVVYTMEDSGIATVDASGGVTGVKAGATNLTITATTADGKKSASKTVVVTVLALPEVSAATITLYAGDTAPVAVQTSPADNILQYSSNDTNIASVTSDGKVTGVSAGTATILVRATTVDGLKTVETAVPVTVLALPTVQVSNKYLYAGDSVNAQAIATPADAVLSYQTLNPEIATVDAAGNITGVRGGTTILRVTATTADNQKSSSQEVTIRVYALPEIIAQDFSIYQSRTEAMVYLATPLTTTKTFSSGNEAIATVDEQGNVTGVSAGTTTITITATTADAQKSTTKTVNVTVLDLPQVSADDQHVYSGDSQALNYTASPLDATMTFTVADQAIADVDASGVLSGINPGTTTVTIRATTADGKEVAERTITITVLALPTVTAQLDTLYVDDTFQTAVQATPDNGSMSYAITDETIATVDGSGLVHAKAAGTTTLTVTVTTVDGEKYAQTRVPVHVLTLPQLSVDAMQIYSGDNQNAGVHFSPADATFSYATADSTIAEVYANGVVAAKSVGTTTLTVTLTTPDGRKTVVAENKITVLALPQLDVSDMVVYLDDALNMAITYTPADAALTYQSADPSVATIDDAGMITPKKAGTTTITGTLTTADGQKTITDTAVLTVLPLPTVSIADIEIYTGDAAIVNPQFTPADATISYSSSQPDIASVDASGQVNGISAGTSVITITATTADGRKTVSSTGTVTVLPLPEIATDDQCLYVGDTVAIEVTAGQTGYSYQYSSDHPEIASVDANGNITGGSPGAATITIVATTTDGQKTTTTTMTATVLALPSVQAENVVLYSGDYAAASAVFAPADAVLQWSIEDQTIATIDSNGRVYGQKAGTTNLTATVTTADGLKTASQTVVITVLDLPMLEVSPRALYVGDQQGSGIQYSPADATTTYVSADTAIAAVDANGNISGIAPGTTELTVTLVTADGQKTITKKTTITVYALPTITAQNIVMYSGDSSAIASQYTPASATLNYQSTDENIATVDNQGGVTGISPGETTVTATATTPDGQKTASTTITVTVLALPELSLESITLYSGDSASANPVYTPNDAVLTYKTANPAIADVSADGTISGITPGTTELIVTLMTADHQKTLLAKTAVTVLAQPTVLIDNQSLYFGDTKAVELAYTPADAILNYTIENSAIATIDESGTITAHRIGTTTLKVSVTTADQAKTITKTVQLQVLALPEMLFPNNAPVVYAGDALQFAVAYIPTDAVVAYRIDDPTIATINDSGLIQGISPGTTTLTVTLTTRDGQKTATKTAVVTVLALPSIQVNAISVYTDNTASINAVYSPADVALSYYTDDVQTAEINDSGTVIGKQPGTTGYAVTATTADGLKTATARSTIAVLALPQAQVADQSVYLDETKTIVPEFSPADATIAYQVGDQAVATIDTAGVITPKAAGTTGYTMTVTTKDGLKTAISEAKITVLPLPQVAVTNAAEIAAVYQDDTAQIQVQKTPADAVITYAASDPAIITVTDSGEIQALMPGTTTITVSATTADRQKTATTEITVSVLAMPELTVEPLALYVGDENPLSISYQPNDANLSYASSDENIAVVDSFGMVRAKSAGVSEITVTLTTADNKKTIEKTIPVTVQDLPTVTFNDQSVYMGDSDIIIYEKTPETASVQYTVADSAILTIDSNGQIRPQQAGKTAVVLVVTTADGKKTVEAEAVIEVLPLPQVQASDYVVYNGDSIPFVSTYSPNDALISYTVANPAIATITAAGTLTGKTAGSTTATVTVTTADGKKTASKTVKITVYPLPELIIDNQQIYIGSEKTVQLAYQPADVVITYTIADSAIAEVSAEGMLVGIAAGTTELTVTLKTADGLKTTAATVAVTVLPLPDMQVADVNIYAGDTEPLEVSYSPADARIKYQIADPAIAVIDASGNISGKKAGTTDMTITLTTNDGEQVVEKTITITVLALPSAAATLLEVAVGTSKNLNAVYQPQDATVEYLSDDSSIAYVYNNEAGHSSGDVFGVSAGTTTITIVVRTADGQKYAETHAPVTVTGSGTAIAPDSADAKDGDIIIFGLPVTGQNQTIALTGVVLIVSGATLWFLLAKRRKKDEEQQ